MKTEINYQFLIEQYNQLVAAYSGLEYGIDKLQDCFFVTGVLSFSASFNQISIRDSYLIRIDIPWNFDLFHIPLAYELAGRIPKSFHHYVKGNLCLGINIANYEKISQDCTLLGYVDNLLVPFLYAYSYYEKYGKMPYGNEGHDRDAVFLYFKEKFSDVPEERLLDLIIYMYMPHVYGSHRPCLCGSGLPMRSCHFNLLKELIHIYPRDILIWNIKEFIIQFIEKNIYYKSMLSPKIIRQFYREITKETKLNQE